MEFLYRQDQQGEKLRPSALGLLGIEKLLLKRIDFERDRLRVTKKSHYHTSFEVHIIVRGFQVYETETQKIRVDEGRALVIPPFCKHIALSEDPHTVKYAFSFALGEGLLSRDLTELSDCITRPVPEALLDGIRFVAAETEQKMPFGALVAEHRIAECLLHLARLWGVREPTDTHAPADTREDPRILLARQYVEDNLCRSISLSELACYCYVSEKHLERIFAGELGCTVMDFVRDKKCRQIERLLADRSLTLGQISEIMNFNSECYFNTFFKKYAGMTPGAYRKTVLKQ